MNIKNGIRGLIHRRFIGATRYSWQGLRSCFLHEEAFRFELFVGVLLLPCAFLLTNTVMELCLLIGTMLLVLIVELMNSALEAAIDMFGSEWQELAGRAKDQGSAAVFLSMILLLLVWGLIGWQNWVA